MNCKDGDLAIKVTAMPGAWIPAGAVVKVLKFAGVGSARLSTGLRAKAGARWYVEYNGSHINPHTGNAYTALDSQLRPIRDQPGADETLTWAPVPSKVAA